LVLVQSSLKKTLTYNRISFSIQQWYGIFDFFSKLRSSQRWRNKTVFNNCW